MSTTRSRPGALRSAWVLAVAVVVLLTGDRTMGPFTDSATRRPAPLPPLAAAAGGLPATPQGAPVVRDPGVAAPVQGAPAVPAAELPGAAPAAPGEPPVAVADEPPTAPVEPTLPTVPTGPTGPTGPVPPVVVGPAGIAVVPATIDPSGATDVTDDLNAWLAAVPAGATAQLLPGARYRIEGTLALAGRRGFTLDGEGATLFATTPGDRTRSQISITHGSDVRITDLVITGANPAAGTGDAAYVESREAQHGIAALAVRGLRVDNVTISDTYGDFLYLGPRKGVPTSGVHVHDNDLRRSGRQGIALTGVVGALIEDNLIAQTRRATFDFEANFPTDTVSGVTIRDNRIGDGRLLFIAAAGKGEVSDIVVERNVLSGRAMNAVVESRGPVRNHDWTVVGNTSDSSYGSPLGGVLRFTGVDRITVTGNVQPVQRDRDMHLVLGSSSCGLQVSGNTVPNGAEAATRSPCPTGP